MSEEGGSAAAPPPSEETPTKKSGRRGTDLFAVAIKERDADKGSKEKNVDEERSVLIMGSKRGGKSTIVLRFLERLADVPKPTMALEYTFGRRQHSNNLGKDITHLWELGGGANLVRLMDSVVTPQSLRSLSCVVAIDLSKPKELWHTLSSIMQSLRDRVERVLSDLIAKDSRVPGHLRKKAWARIGDDHKDKDILDPLPIPFVILGTKYDLFQDFDSEHRKIICKTLRFVAHMNGASLHFVSDKDEALVSRCKGLMAGLAFKSSTSTRGVSLDHNRPLLIAAGLDSLAQIGAPPDIGGGSSARDPFELWHEAFDHYFPPEDVAPGGGGDGDASISDTDPARDPKFAEASIDDLRSQKDDMLERYRKQADRRARELAAKHAAAGSSSSSSRKSRKAAAPPSESGKSSRRSRRSTAAAPPPVAAP